MSRRTFITVLSALLVAVPLIWGAFAWEDGQADALTVQAGELAELDVRVTRGEEQDVCAKCRRICAATSRPGTNCWEFCRDIGDC